MKNAYLKRGGSMILSMVMLLGMLALPAASKGRTVYLGETFESGTDGQEINGFNDWFSTTEGSRRIDAFATVKEIDGGRAMLYSKTQGDSDSQDVVASKDLTESYSGGFLSAKFRLRQEAGMNIAIIQLAGSKYNSDSESGWLNTVFDFAGKRIYLGNVSYKADFTFTAGIWYDFEVAIDTVNQTYALYQNGNALIGFSDCGGVSNADLGRYVTKFIVKTDRTKGVATGGGSFYVDDILVTGKTAAEFDADLLTVPASTAGEDLVLPETGQNQSTITWTSSNRAVISDGGEVTLPQMTELVTLTATVTNGTDTTDKTFPVRVLDADTYVYEDFEAPEFTSLPILPSTPLEGWNGWITSAGSSSYVIDTNYEVKAENGNPGNKVLSSIRTGTPGSTSSYVTIKKDFKDNADSGLLSVSFRYKKVTETLGRTQVSFADENGNSEYFTIYPVQGCIDIGSTSAYRKYMLGKTSTSILPVGWYEFEVVLDLDNKKYSIYHDGYTLVEDFDYLNTDMGSAIKAISFYGNRSEGAKGSEYYIDDIMAIKLTDEGICQKAILPEGRKIDNIRTRENITLPTEGYRGAVLSWTSSDPEVLAADGTVTPKEEEDANITLTLTAEYGSAAVSKSYHVLVPGNTTYDKAAETESFFEKFEDEAAGTSLNGYKDWTSTVTANTGMVLDAEVNIGAVPGEENQALFYNKTAAADNSQDVTARRQFDVISGGYAVISFRLRFEEGAKQIICMVSDSDGGWVNFVFDRNGSRILPGGAAAAGYTIPHGTWNIGEWYEYDLVLDVSGRRYQIFENGTSLNDMQVYMVSSNSNLGTNIRSVGFKTERKAGVVTTGGSFYIDDVRAAAAPEALLAARYLKVEKAAGTNNLSLPAEGLYGTAVTWKSSNPGIIAADGTVTPGGKTETVTLTASVVKHYIESTKEFKIKVLDENTYLYEDFEAPEFTSLPIMPGTSVDGWNGWITTAGSSTYVIDTKYEVKAEIDSPGNKVLSSIRTGAPGSTSSYITIKKDFKETISEGLVSVRFRYKKVTSTLGRTQITLLDENGKGEFFTIYPVNGCVDLNGVNANRKYMFGRDSSFYLPVGWYEFEAIFDPENRTYSLYHDGYVLAEDFPYQNGEMGTTLKAISIYGTRNEGALGSEFYIDDVIVADFTDKEACEKALRDAKRYFGNGILSENVTLPTEGVGGATISWETSDDTAVTSTGEINPGLSAKYAVLTAVAECGGASSTASYRVKISGSSELLNEDFDFPIVSAGTDLSNFNGWTVTTADISTYTLDTALKIENVDENNKALKISRSDANANSADVSASKTFNTAIGGRVTASMKVMRENAEAKGFNIKIAGTYLNFDMPNNRILGTSNTPAFDPIQTPGMAVGIWHEIVIEADIDASTFSVSVNGNLLASGVPLVKNTGLEDKISISASRLNNSSGAVFYVDDLVLTHESVYTMSVCGIEFKDAGGSTVPQKTDGGTVSTVTVMAKDYVEKASVAVAVYDADGNMVSIVYKSITEPMDYPEAAVLEIDGALPEEDAESSVVKAFVLGGIDSLMPISAPLIHDASGEDMVTLFLCGDSLTQTYSGTSYPMTGWGQLVGSYFDSEKVSVRNLAVGGRSTKSFYNENRLQNVLNEVKAGDYVFIMFGHNDQSSDQDKHTEPDTTYKAYLRQYILMARHRGAIPVLMTPVTRRYFTEGVFDANAMGDYPDAMREVAEEMKVKLIDTHAMSKALVANLGDEPSKELYMHVYVNDERYLDDPAFENSQYKNITETHVDNTHMNKYGAGIITEFIVSEIERLALPVSYYLLQD